MGIRLEQPGAAKAAATAGAMVGKSERAKEDRARAEQQRQQAESIATQQSARQMAMQWEQEKMMLNSQQDFAHEMRMRQAGLDAEARAREWEVEKMELHSKFDFEQDEKERLRRKAEYTAGRDSIDKNEGLTDGQKNTANFLLSTKYSDLSEAATGLGLKPESKKGLFDFGLGSDTGLTPGGTATPTVDNPLGLNIENIPVSQLPQTVLNLEAQNKFEVISPDGVSETIDASEWPVKKAQGYILSQIRKLRETGATPFPLRKVGSISDLVSRLKRPAGSISDLVE